MAKTSVEETSDWNGEPVFHLRRRAALPVAVAESAEGAVAAGHDDAVVAGGGERGMRKRETILLIRTDADKIA